MSTPKSTPYPFSLDQATLISLRDKAWHTLDKLITPKGIYASMKDGWKGPYHSWFGRDSAITADLLIAALEYGGDEVLAKRAGEALLAFASWQGKKDEVTTGEEKGKMPHEIRDSFDAVHTIQHAPSTNKKPWYVDPADGVLKNWDSVDSTALWVLAVVRLYEALHLSYTPKVILSMRSGLEWILDNLEKNDGLVGFIGADLQPGRVYSGLHNQGWKDSFHIYQHLDGTLAKQPIKDVLVNAEVWAALSAANDIYADIDSAFAQRLSSAQHRLRRRFNTKNRGFLLPSAEYFTQALDGDGKQLPQWSADVAVCLWANHQGECVIKDRYIEVIAKTICDPLFLNPQAGIRNYAYGTKFPEGTKYHGSDDTYWPFVSALIARGLAQFSYHNEATRITEAYLKAIASFGSNIEMFRENPEDHKLTAWHHPQVGQESSVEQAWTAAAAYYGSLFLINFSR